MALPNRRVFLHWALLAVATSALFEGSFQYFFQGDSLHWLAHRYSSLGQFAEALTSVDSYGYFRPLSHPLIPSLFHPIFNFQPWGYHWVVFLLYLLTVWLLYVFFRALLGSDWEAFAGSLFFAVHSVNAFVTFDFAFEPELLCGFWYLLAAFCFLKSWRTGRRVWAFPSILCFALSLLSKEAAVTLPANLLLLALFARGPAPFGLASGEARTDTSANPKTHRSAFKAVVPHLILLVGYFSYLMFSLQGGRALLGATPLGGEASSLAATVWSNLGLALPWAMNLAAGWTSAWRHLPSGLEGFLWLFASLPVGGALLAVFGPTPAKRPIRLGLLWFLVALAPMLVLNDFKSYYLYVPLMGLSLAVGRTLGWARSRVPDGWSLPANLAMGLALFTLAVSCRLIVKGDLAKHPLLGGGARTSERLAAGIKRIRPDLPKGSTILILDTADRPLVWHCARGALFRLLYQDPSLKTLFASLGEFPTPEELAGSGFAAISFQADAPRDATAEIRRQPGLPPAEEVTYSAEVRDLIRVRPETVIRGEGRYTLAVAGWGERAVEIQFRINGGRVGSFRTRLDPRGRINFFVSKETPPGTYEFLAVRDERGKWTKSLPPATLEVESGVGPR